MAKEIACKLYQAFCDKTPEDEFDFCSTPSIQESEILKETFLTELAQWKEDVEIEIDQHPELQGKENEDRKAEIESWIIPYDDLEEQNKLLTWFHWLTIPEEMEYFMEEDNPSEEQELRDKIWDEIKWGQMAKRSPFVKETVDFLKKMQKDNFIEMTDLEPDDRWVEVISCFLFTSHRACARKDKHTPAFP